MTVSYGRSDHSSWENSWSHFIPQMVWKILHNNWREITGSRGYYLFYLTSSFFFFFPLLLCVKINKNKLGQKEFNKSFSGQKTEVRGKTATCSPLEFSRSRATRHCKSSWTLRLPSGVVSVSSSHDVGECQMTPRSQHLNKIYHPFLSLLSFQSGHLATASVSTRIWFLQYQRF